MKKKFFTLFFALAASVGTIFAESSGTCGANLTWTLSDDGVLTISGTGAMTGYSSSAPWYSSRSSITSVIISDGVTSIGYWAFMGCSHLTSVTIGNSVTSIGGDAFFLCTSLTSVTIPNSVTSIGNGAFFGCSSLPVVDNLRYADTYLVEAVDTPLSSYTIKEGTKWIGNGAFSGCSSLTSIEIPNSVTSIGEEAFSGCSGLTSIEIPNSVTSIGSNAFSNVLNIAYNGTATGAPWGAKCINGYVDGYLVYSDESKTNIAGCSVSAIEIVIPNTVTSIGNHAFSYCRSLTSVTIPNSVTSIGNYAFSGCSSLTSVTIPNSVTSIGNNAFDGCSSLTSVTIPNSVTSIGGSAFYGCSSLSIICSVPATRPAISSNTFRGIASDVVVYVSNEAVSNYKNSSSTNYWKDLNIVGIDFFGAEKSETPTSVTLTTTALLWEIAGLYVASVGIEGGEQEAGNTLEYIGLEPNSEYKDVPVVLTSNTGETETVNVTFTTTALTLTTQQPKVVSSTTAILLAETNMSDAEVNCGFEWKRENAPDAMAGTKVYCPVANGTMAGRLKGLKDDVYYKYRAFYQSMAGNTYYGDWQYIFTGDDAVEFDPVMYTYAASAVTETEATLKGYALAGSDEFTEQGFEYWVESRVIPEGANHAPARAYQNAIGEHQSVQATGISMKVTLTNLDEGTVYKYRTYAVVNGAKVYGSEMSFTTRGEYLYTVTFVDYDGTILSSDKVHYGTAATAPEDPSRGGYNFSGWDKDYSNVTDDLIVTAQYTVSTALPQATTDSSVQKFIRDGQLFIQKSGKTYTIQGVEVK